MSDLPGYNYKTRWMKLFSSISGSTKLCGRGRSSERRATGGGNIVEAGGDGGKQTIHCTGNHGRSILGVQWKITHSGCYWNETVVARIQLMVLALIYRAYYIGQAPKYLRDLIRLPFPAIPIRPLRSMDRHDLSVTRVRTSMAKTRVFPIIGPALWNHLQHLRRSSLY